MYSDFAKLFYKEAVQREFRFLKESGTNVIDGDTNVLAFQKNIGKDLLMLRLFNMQAVNTSVYTNTREAVSAALLRNKKDYYARVVLLDIFYGEEASPAIDEIINAGEEFLNQPCYAVCWGVFGGRIVVNKNQPTDIGGVNAIIKNVLTLINENKTIDAVYINELQQLSEQTDPHKIKTDKPLLSYALIVVNCVMLLLTYAAGGTSADVLLDMGALERTRVFAYNEYYRLFTVMFLHGSAAHLLSNCLGLFIFGTRVERHFGRTRFNIIYFMSGILGSVFSLIFSSGVAVGASGAIYGLVGASLARSVITRRSLDGLPLDFFLIYSILSISLGFLDPQIGNAAHIGGFLSGALCGALIRERETQY